MKVCGFDQQVFLVKFVYLYTRIVFGVVDLSVCLFQCESVSVSPYLVYLVYLIQYLVYQIQQVG